MRRDRRVAAGLLRDAEDDHRQVDREHGREDHDRQLAAPHDVTEHHDHRHRNDGDRPGLDEVRERRRVLVRMRRVRPEVAAAVRAQLLDRHDAGRHARAQSSVPAPRASSPWRRLRTSSACPATSGRPTRGARAAGTPGPWRASGRRRSCRAASGGSLPGPRMIATAAATPVAAVTNCRKLITNICEKYDSPVSPL